MFGSDCSKHAKDHLNQVKSFRQHSWQPHSKRSGIKKQFFRKGTFSGRRNARQRSGAPVTFGQGTSPERNRSPSTRVVSELNCQTQCTHHATISVSQLNEVNPLSCQIRLGEMGIVLIDIQSSPTGWLAHFLVNWQKVTEDQWILNTVKGYQISFVVNPYQERKPHPSHFNLDQQGWWNTRLGNCVTKGR